jgi:hypothetical protein
MSERHMLVAYLCTFRYAQKYNPILDELKRNNIEVRKDLPKEPFDKVLAAFIEKLKNPPEEPSDKITQVMAIDGNESNPIEIEKRIIDGENIERRYLKPLAGRIGVDFKVFKRMGGSFLDFSSTDVSASQREMFVYDGTNSNDFVVIFHFSSSVPPFKYLFDQTINRFIREKGFYFDMKKRFDDVSDEIGDEYSDRMSLEEVEFLETDRPDSSNETENTKRNKSKTYGVSGKVTLDLKTEKYDWLKQAFFNFRHGKIERNQLDDALSREKAVFKGFDTETTRIKVRINGTTTKTITLNQLTVGFLGRDITDELQPVGASFNPEKLKEIADEYYAKIMRAKENE